MTNIYDEPEILGHEYQYHRTAIIDDGAIVGEGTKIWHWTHIMSGAKIGKNCRIGANVIIHNGVTIGDNCCIQNFNSIPSGITIEDDVFIGAFVGFCNIKHPKAWKENKNYEKTILCKGCSIGANATIGSGIRIGKLALVGMGSVVNKNIPDAWTIFGNPARRLMDDVTAETFSTK